MTPDEIKTLNRRMFEAGFAPQGVEPNVRARNITEEEALAAGVRLPSHGDDEEEDRKFTLCPTCDGTGLYVAQSLGGAVFDVDCTDCDTAKKRFALICDSFDRDSV